MAQLSRTLSAAARSPWCWPILPLLTVAAVGQWVSVLAAEAVAGAFGAVGLGIAIGLAIAGRQVMPKRRETRSGKSSPQSQPPGASSAATSSGAGTQPVTPSPAARAADLRGAKLANTKLVRADLRQADLRGAVLAGADLTGADLTGAHLGPLDDEPTHEGSPRPTGS